MIIVQLFGGLGNQMFQYAFGRELARRLNTELKLDISSYNDRKEHRYSLTHFNIKEEFADAKTLKNIVPFFKVQKFLLKHIGFTFSRNLLIERSFNYDPRTLHITGNILLCGYWQSERYFKHSADHIMNEFRLKSAVSDAGRSVSERIVNENSVSIHVRRGDYVRDDAILSKHGICDLDYYKKAVSMIIDRVPSPHFYLFSDDPDWVRQSFQWLEPSTLVAHNDASGNYEDLWLMSQCKHNIIANSSFSWWGAWLNTHPHKVVIAPVRWFADATINTATLIPGEWIKLGYELH